MTKRRCDIIKLNNAVLTELIQPCFPEQLVINSELMVGGLINTNYKIHLSKYKEPIIARIYARDADACQHETDIIPLIKDTVPVPKVFHACSASSTSAINKPYAILEWCSGITLDNLLNYGSSSDMEKTVYAAGETLARIGKYTFSRSGFFGPGLVIEHAFDNDATAFMNKCLANPLVKTRLGIKLHEQISQFIAENAFCLKDISAQSVLVHGDFNSNNILVKQINGQWLISAILDWEWAHAGTFLFDVGSMLRYQSKYYNMQSSFTRGFTDAGGKLPNNWKQISKFIDLNNLLEFLISDEERQQLFDEVKQLISETMSDWNKTKV